MANEPHANIQPQHIPLEKIHDLPGTFINKAPDKSHGGLVTSIQANGVKEPVILRQREDGEYQLVSGYRRVRASELAKKKDIPAHVYEMTVPEAIAYYKQAKKQPDAPIPGKLKTPSVPEVDKAPVTAPKATEVADPKATAKGDKPKEVENPVTAPAEKTTVTAPKPTEVIDPKTTAKGAKPKEVEKPVTAPVDKATASKPTEAVDPKTTAKGDNPKEVEKPVTAPAEKATATASKPTEVADPKIATKGDKPKEVEKPVTAPAEKATATAPKPTEVADPKATAKGDKPKEVEKPVTAPAEKATATAPKPTEAIDPKQTTAAQGPMGTVISKVYPEQLGYPTGQDLKGLPVPKEDESLFIRLHPAYLEKSQYNRFGVDTNSENYKELKKSIELTGIKDPVLTRLKPDGGLEILSGQRRHMVATELNYPVPAIIQKIDDADAKIIVADGNLHRPQLTSYDLSRALRMKMEGMKQKAGRRKKGDTSASALNSDEKLAAEMGMSVSKLNRIIRLSEATETVCTAVDNNDIALSIASAISFLQPANQDMVVHLTDLGFKVTNERITRVRTMEKAGKLDEMTMRGILEDKDLAPKVVTPPPAPVAPATPAPTPVATPNAPTSATPPVPPSPDVKSTPPDDEPPFTPDPPATVEKVPVAPPVDNSGKQERPEHLKVVLTGDRLRRYFPDVEETPRAVEESIYEALEERRQRQERQKQKTAIFPPKKNGPTR